MGDPMNIPQGSVIITPTDMYREMQEIGKKVDHLASVVDPAIAQLRETATENRAMIKAGEVRQDKIENSISWLRGVGTTVTVLLTSGLVTALIELYHH